MKERLFFWTLCYVSGFFANFVLDGYFHYYSPKSPKNSYQKEVLSIRVSTRPSSPTIYFRRQRKKREERPALQLHSPVLSLTAVYPTTSIIQLSPAPTPGLTSVATPVPLPTTVPSYQSTSLVVSSVVPTLPNSAFLTAWFSPASSPFVPSSVPLSPTLIPSLTSASTPTPAPTQTLIEQSLTLLNQSLLQSDSQVFYQLLSDGLSALFTKQAIDSSFQKAQSVYGRITEIKPLTTPLQQNEWVTQKVEVKTENGLSSRFKIVLHRESGGWKLFGTQKVP